MAEPLARFFTSPETRDFETLGHHLRDLGIAEDALERARQHWGEDDVFLADRLLESAALAYCRCFGGPEARRALDSFIEVPSAFADVAEKLRAYRNRSVAHSIAGDSRTVTVALFRDGADASYVELGTVTLSARPTREFIDQFMALVQETTELATIESKAIAEATAKRLTIDYIETQSMVAPTVTPWDPQTDRHKSPVFGVQITIE